MAKTNTHDGWGRDTDRITYRQLEKQISRLQNQFEETGVKDRKLYYLRHIKDWFDKKELTETERNRVLTAGWTKVKEYVGLLSRNKGSRQYYKKWTAFATDPRVTTEMIKQAVWRLGPSVPEEERVESFVLWLQADLKQELADALELRGRRPYVRGRRGGIPDQADERNDQLAVMRLLRDAKRGRREQGR